MNHVVSAVAALLTSALAIAGCSAVEPSAACANAAVRQAAAERAYGTSVEAHEAAHAAGEDHTDEDIFDARVTMILAEAETRRHCG
ncbi:hypothetical protein [Candidatus Poriferisodalis sp.]|uniref:hypothetical protein n=1 Tax=Candidatus Poriferisodalis sp. TaxID=3101277 RepID=UPI003B02B45D